MGGTARLVTLPCESHFAVASAAGATISSKIVDTPWGDRMYTTRDLEGQRWIFAQHVLDVVPAAPQRA
jgi:uncharacterized glyoxalase superfamily protein PhnB